MITTRVLGGVRMLALAVVAGLALAAPTQQAQAGDGGKKGFVGTGFHSAPFPFPHHNPFPHHGPYFGKPFFPFHHNNFHHFNHNNFHHFGGGKSFHHGGGFRGHR